MHVANSLYAELCPLNTLAHVRLRIRASFRSCTFANYMLLQERLAVRMLKAEINHLRLPGVADWPGLSWRHTQCVTMKKGRHWFKCTCAERDFPDTAIPLAAAPPAEKEAGLSEAYGREGPRRQRDLLFLTRP